MSATLDRLEAAHVAATGHQPITNAELDEIRREQATAGVLYPGCTHVALVARYGDRLYHQWGVGWFLRPLEVPA